MTLKPCILGLGYVGLPIFQQLKTKFYTLGFDKDKKRIEELKKKIDRNREYSKTQLSINNSELSFNHKDLIKSNFFIVCVPTPIFPNKKPNLGPLITAMSLIAKSLKKNDIVFIESTVFPGTTEYLCKNILEKKSKLKEGFDFFIGYSPERINPGDKHHNVNKVKKIVSIKTNQLNVIAKVKRVYKAISKNIIVSKNIREAEAAKVFENVQRDVNIALINELFIISQKLNINFQEVFKLASTKWNFLPFKPGLVGGHCLPVDPYYLSYISKKNKYNPRILLAGRKINDDMEKYVIQLILKQIHTMKNKNLLFVGLSYKDNVADMRNSLSFNVFNYFLKKKYNVMGLEPHLPLNLKIRNVVRSIKDLKKYNIIVILNKHSILKNFMKLIKKKNLLIIDPFSKI